MDERVIRDGLQRLRVQIRSGDESELLFWVIPGKLAASQRPLRDHPVYGERRPLPLDARPFVVAWVDRVKQEGIRSILCLLEDAQLDRYYVRGGLELHEEGLLGYYQSQGMQVRHMALTDYQRPSEATKQLAFNAYVQLPKPVLVHCSAGIDRTTPVVAYIGMRDH